MIYVVARVTQNDVANVVTRVAFAVLELLNCGFRDDTTGANVGATTINAIFRSYFAPSDVLNLDSVATRARVFERP